MLTWSCRERRASGRDPGRRERERERDRDTVGCLDFSLRASDDRVVRAARLLRPLFRPESALQGRHQPGTYRPTGRDVTPGEPAKVGRSSRSETSGAKTQLQFPNPNFEDAGQGGLSRNEGPTGREPMNIGSRSFPSPWCFFYQLSYISLGLLSLLVTCGDTAQARPSEAAEWLGASNHTNNWAVLVDTSRYW